MCSACAARVPPAVFSAHPSAATSYALPPLAAAAWTGARALYHKLPPWQAWQPPRFAALAVPDLRARAAALLGDAGGAAIADARLRPSARYFAAGGIVAIDGSAGQTPGCLAACLGKPGTAVRHPRAAIAASQHAALPPSELQSRYELAKVLARRGQREGRFRSARPRGRCRPRRRPARHGPPGSRRRAPVHDDAEWDSGPAGRTRCEREIAELAGRGLTNRQIAALLHVAERTAGNPRPAHPHQARLPQPQPDRRLGRQNDPRRHRRALTRDWQA